MIPNLLNPKITACCEVRVHLSKVDTLTRRCRILRAENLGHPPDQCGVSALHLVDGVPMCRRHAAEAALRWVEENQ